MYPANYFGLFPAFPREEKVFVAMSFDQKFESRWSQVIAPAISRVAVNGKNLEAVRVDARRISDSILTEILSGITRSRLVFGDVTTFGHVDGRPVRNGNVMYEVGIAHAVRLPEEVLLFRSDDDRLLFDVANVRVNFYNPDEDPETAQSLILESIVDAMKSLELLRHSAVGKAVESLDYPSWTELRHTVVSRATNHPESKNYGQLVANASRAGAIRNLLNLGTIRASFLAFTPEKYEELKALPESNALTYECTEFGLAVFQEVLRRMGTLSPEMQAILKDDPQEATDNSPSEK